MQRTFKLKLIKLLQMECNFPRDYSNIETERKLNTRKETPIDNNPLKKKLQEKENETD